MAMWQVAIRTDGSSDQKIQVPGDNKKEALMNAYVIAIQNDKVYGVSVLGPA